MRKEKNDFRKYRLSVIFMNLKNEFFVKKSMIEFKSFKVAKDIILEYQGHFFLILKRFERMKEQN